MAFPPENLKIWVHSCEIHAFIQTATYPPFTGREMILSFVRLGVAEEFVQLCACLRVNKRSHITLDRIGKAVAQK